MTKLIRIENADCGTHFKPVVQIWDKQFEKDDTGNWKYSGNDVLTKEIVLNNPFDLTESDVYITNTRYLIIKELEENV